MISTRWRKNVLIGIVEGNKADSNRRTRLGGDFFADSDVILAEKIICLTGSGVITRGAGVGGSLLTITGGSLTLGGNVTLSGANAEGANGGAKFPHIQLAA